MIKQNQYSHDRLLSECFLYTWNNFPATQRLLFHPNNEARPYRGEKKEDYIKRLSLNFSIGVVAGVCDLIFYWKNRLHVFDIKIDKDRLSNEQIDFMNKTIANGGTAHTIISLEQFKNIFITLYHE